MRSVLHELSRIGEKEREYVSPVSEGQEEEGENIPQNKANHFCQQQHMHCCFLFLFPSSSLFRLRKE